MSARWERHLAAIVDFCTDYDEQLIVAPGDRRELWDRIVEFVQDIECDKCEHNRDPPDEDWRD